MSHSNTEQLIDYWRMRRGGASVPTRASIDPSDMTALLPQIFITGRAKAGDYPLRLVGGFVAELHGHDLRGENLLHLWDVDSRTTLQGAIEAARRPPHPLVIDCEAQTHDGLAMSMELVIAPLAGPSGDMDRLIGLYQPTAPVALLRGRPARRLCLRSIKRAGAPEERFGGLRLAAVNGRRIA
jgi:hypothetical protein